MSDSIKTYVKAIPRHNRIMIFVDNGISEEALRNIMEANLHIWGGRYNPIVPVTNNVIFKEWIDVIKHFDPDYIYYSKKIDLQYLKALNLFQPKEYIEFDDKNIHFHFPGLNIHNLLHKHVHDALTNSKLALLYYDGNWDMPLIAKEFYRLNLGFKALYAGEHRWINNYEVIKVNKHDAHEINKLIYEKNPYFKSLLSALHVNSICLNTNESWQMEQFEWIIYRPENFLYDLLYFWNRQLYIEPNNRIQQVISTQNEFEQLLNDTNLEGLLCRLSVSNRIYLLSRSLDSSLLEEIQKKAQSKTSNVRILSKTMDKFPFQIEGVKHLSSKYIKPSNNLILGKKDFLIFPVLSFEGGITIDSGTYALDIRVERDQKDEHKEIKFPYGTSLFHLVCEEKTRVNKEHRISIFLNKEKQGTEFSVPTDFEIIRAVLMFRVKQNDFIDLPIHNITLSTGGQKLSAFFNLFDKDWSVIKHFLEEKFWLQLFRYDTDIEGSAIPPGKGIFSYKDLEKEIDGLFEKYNAPMTQRINRRTEQKLDEKIIQQIILRDKKETFEYFIDPDLKYLINKGALFIGMKVNCEQCGSNKWYSLNELSDKFTCKGCNNEITPNIESSIYYKLSEIVINNLLSDQTRNVKQYDGNYIVIKTLLNLKQNFSNHIDSFIWCPCLDFTTKLNENNWSSDLDILVIQNGKLIVGEAKSRSDQFNTKEIRNMAWIANNIMPDKIMVACNTGNLDGTVEKIQALKTNPNCEIISYVASKPWYHFRGLFGLPKDRNDSSPTIPASSNH